MKKNASCLTQYVKDNTALEIKPQTGKQAKKVIVLALGLQSTNPDAYKLTVTSNKITITGASESGVFYGIQTLRKSIPVMKTAQVEMPAVVINDAPRFSYRGMMLDVSRYFFTKDYVMRYLDMMAMHKMNVLHWHLIDDCGWRI